MTYIHETGLLFETVQTMRVFPDNKTFPDCIPKSGLDEIIRLFTAEKAMPGFDLSAFVYRHFLPPPSAEEAYESDITMSAEQHIEELWDVLERKSGTENSSLIPLPYPYIVPGGRFREVYYWDSYFTMLGLKVSGRIDRVRQMIDNFSYLLDTVGHIPNGNRAYYTGRSQPPFFTLMVDLLDEEADSDVWRHYLSRLEKEYAFWMSGAGDLSTQNTAVKRVVRMPDGSVLNRFWDTYDTPRPEAFHEDTALAQLSDQDQQQLFRHLRAAAESGWDFSSRWFRDPGRFDSIHTTDIIPVDLNCLLYYMEWKLAGVCQGAGHREAADKYLSAAETRRRAIEKYCWDEKRGFYFDFDFPAECCKTSYTLAAVYPLFFGLSSDGQASRVARVLEDKFLKKGGLMTTLEHTGQQWDAPNGWAPLQWMAFKGLGNYSLTATAEKIKAAWTALNHQVYHQTGKMTEKYNVVDSGINAGGGEYPNQDGFGWTNGVYLKMIRG